MHTFTPYMLMKDNFGAEFLICDKLRANAQTLSGSSPAQNKKRAAVATLFYLVRETGLEPVENHFIFSYKSSETLIYSHF